jgi:hypothetical protein
VGVDICLFIVIPHRRFSITDNGGGLKLTPRVSCLGVRQTTGGSTSGNSNTDTQRCASRVKALQLSRNGRWSYWVIGLSSRRRSGYTLKSSVAKKMSVKLAAADRQQIHGIGELSMRRVSGGDAVGFGPKFSLPVWSEDFYFSLGSSGNRKFWRVGFP